MYICIRVDPNLDRVNPNLDRVNPNNIYLSMLENFAAPRATPRCASRASWALRIAWPKNKGQGWATINYRLRVNPVL